MILEWRQDRPLFVITWVGPNKISSKAAIPISNIANVLAVISGPKGDKGDTGAAGTGAYGEMVSWTPPSASATWVIPHDMNKYPSISVVDTTGRLVTPDITYLSTALVEVSFAFPTSGTAYLN